MNLPSVTIPVVRPSPPKLSEHLEELLALEASGTYTNFGPLNRRLETELTHQLFGQGDCLAVCNATSGLMLALREVMGETLPSRRRYALMPSFTFAAAAQAALWCGLTPLLCDIDPHTWLPSALSEERLLQRYRGEIAVIVPYATFGNNLDLQRYQRLSSTFGVPVVVDAAASLGSQDAEGNGFGTGFRWPIVFSMHATKSFSVGEGGIVYCADQARLERMRSIASFGFGQPRSATMPGMNAKLPELSALVALLQLKRMEQSTQHRLQLSARYEETLPGSLRMQRTVGQQVKAFESILLPPSFAARRNELMERMAARGVGTAHYFSPHLAEQPFLARHSKAEPLPVTRDVAGRILSLPLLAEMPLAHVDEVVRVLGEVLADMERQARLLPLPASRFGLREYSASAGPAAGIVPAA